MSMDLKNYLEQHESIKEEMNAIKKLTASSNIADHARDIALHISTLAGRIKIHLSMEDKYLYPGLKERGSEQIKNMATAYQKEMGGLADVFVIYKDQYNTAPKIQQNLKNLKSDTDKVFSEIEKRINKEESELYKFI